MLLTKVFDFSIFHLSRTKQRPICLCWKDSTFRGWLFVWHDEMHKNPSLQNDYWGFYGFVSKFLCFLRTVGSILLKIPLRCCLIVSRLVGEKVGSRLQWIMAKNDQSLGCICTFQRKYVNEKHKATTLRQTTLSPVH